MTETSRRPRWVWILALLLPGLLLGASGCGGRSCQVGDKMYEDGAEVPAPDGCNTCTCNDGQLGPCTVIACT